MLERCWNDYRSGKAKAALVAAEQALAADPDHGMAHFSKAVALEALGEIAEADRWFQRACQARRHPQSPTCRVSGKIFKALVDACLESLPPPFSREVQEVHWHLADYPPWSVYDSYPEAGIGDEILGLFEGCDRSERWSHFDGPVTGPIISIWRRPLEHQCADQDEFRHELRTTVLHEFGHYLGFDEDGVAAMGLD